MFEKPVVIVVAVFSGIALPVVTDSVNLNKAVWLDVFVSEIADNL